MAKYRSATMRPSSKNLSVEAASMLYVLVSSTIAMTETRDESLKSEIKSLVTPGRAILKAWGRMTLLTAMRLVMPSERAASIWPFGTALIPAPVELCLIGRVVHAEAEKRCSQRIAFRHSAQVSQVH